MQTQWKWQASTFLIHFQSFHTCFSRGLKVRLFLLATVTMIKGCRVSIVLSLAPPCQNDLNRRWTWASIIADEQGSIGLSVLLRNHGSRITTWRWRRGFFETLRVLILRQPRQCPSRVANRPKGTGTKSCNAPCRCIGNGHPSQSLRSNRCRFMGDWPHSATLEGRIWQHS